MNFVSLNAKKTLNPWHKCHWKFERKIHEKKNKKIKKTKRKNLTPSSSKTIFHTLITLKDIFLAHHVIKNCSKTRLSSTSKKFKKIKISKKSVFILWTNPKLEFMWQKIFPTFNHWNFLMCVLQITFPFLQDFHNQYRYKFYIHFRYPLVHYLVKDFQNK